MGYWSPPFIVVLLMSVAVSAQGSPQTLREILLDKALAENPLYTPPASDSSTVSVTPKTDPRDTAAFNNATFSPKSLFVLPISLHQHLITHQDGDTCTFTPSCSHYGVEAIRKHGLAGIFMTSDRILRCRTGNHKYYPTRNGLAYDPVPPKQCDE